MKFATARSVCWYFLTFLRLAFGRAHDTSHKSKKPNILPIIMDDVGIDQMKSFGYGGNPNEPGANNIAPLMPNIVVVGRELHLELVCAYQCLPWRPQPPRAADALDRYQQ